MGYIRHYAIVVTGSYGDDIDKAHAEAHEIFDAPSEPFDDLVQVVTEITPSAVNTTRTFFVAPDGSKEYWPTSDEFDLRRQKFIEYLENTRYSDGSSSLSWVEVRYGDEEGVSGIVNDSNGDGNE